MAKQIMLLGLAGPARSGKSSAAVILETQHGFTSFSFAAPIKRIASCLYPSWDAWHMEGPGKDQVDMALPHPISPREAFQAIGKAMRMVHPDYWVRLTEHELARWRMTRPDRSIDGLPCAVFSDVRYDNEANWIRSLGGTIVHISRAAAPAVREHESELGIQRQPHDIALTNDGTIAGLRMRLADIVFNLLARIDDEHQAVALRAIH